MWLAIGFLPAFLFYTLHLVACSVIYTWSYNGIGSLLMPIMLHGSLNTAAWFFGAEDIPVPGISPLIFLIIFEVILVGFIVKFSGKNLGWNQELDIK